MSEYKTRIIAVSLDIAKELATKNNIRVRNGRLIGKYHDDLKIGLYEFDMVD